MDDFEQLQPQTVWEVVNEERLDWLLAHKSYVNNLDNSLKAKIRQKGGKLNAYDLRRLKCSLYDDLVEYKAKPLVEGGRSVHYGYAHKAREGRLFARGPSLQCFKKTVREFLTAGKLRDWDAENCHPRVISWLCDRHDISHPHLKEYIDSREVILQQLPGTRAEAKEEVLKATYGSTKVLGLDPWLDAFAKEMRKTTDSLVGKGGSPGHQYYLAAAKSKEGNPKFSALSRFIGVIENSMLRVMVAVARERGVGVRSLAFDGFMTDAQVPDNFTEELFKAVRSSLSMDIPIIEKIIDFNPPEGFAARADAIPDDDEAWGEGGGDVKEGDYFMPDRRYITEEEEGEPVPENDVYLEDDILQPDVFGILSLRANMGTGKTYQIVRLIRQWLAMGKTIVLVTQRISMVDTLEEKLGAAGIALATYLQLEGCISILNRVVIIEYESLWRLAPGKIDLIINDEFRSILTTADSSTNGDRKITNHERFKNLLVDADKVVCTDADMDVDGAARRFLDDIAVKRSRTRASACFEAAAEADARGDAAEREAWLGRQRDLMRVQPVTHITSDITRIQRQVNFIPFFGAIWRMRADALHGWRFGVACGGRKRGNAIKEMLLPYVDSPGKIGFYSGRTDNKADLKRLKEMWGRYQIIIFTSVLTTGADYTTPVHRVYAIPTTNCSVPREVLQQTGRFRHVHTNQIWIATGVESLDELAKVDVLAGERLAEEAGERIQDAGGLIGDIVKDQYDRVRLTIGPGVSVEFKRAPHLLQLCAQYVAAERSFVTSDLGMTAVLHHMCGERGCEITWGAGVSEETAELYGAIDKEWKDVLGSLTVTDAALVASIDVRRVAADEDAMKTLAGLAAGRRLGERRKQLFREAYEEEFGDMCLNTLVTAYEKASAARLFPGQGDQVIIEMLAVLRAHHDKLAQVEILSDQDKVTAAVAFLKDVDRHEAMELGKPHPFTIAVAVEEALKCLGLAGVHDKTPVAVEDEARLKTVLHNFKSLGLVKGGDGHVFQNVQRALAKLVGLEVKQGKPSKFIFSMQGFLERGPAWPTAAQWFAERYGEAAPVKDAFKPSRNMTAAQLKELSFKCAEDPNFRGTKRKVDRMLADKTGAGGAEDSRDIRQCFQQAT
jgi:hypothetical protein